MNLNYRQYTPPTLGQSTQAANESGILLIDKPAGISSHSVVADIRHHFQIDKVGHGGTLDPGATGLLLILVGKGTTLSSQIMGCDKKYTGEILLGTETNSQDIEGEVVAELPWDLVTEERLSAEMDKLTGDIYQLPPMVSAVKVNGVPLYKLARKGREVERKPRLIHVYRFKLLGYDAPVGRFEVLCGKGTYVRTLCHDVGKALGCGACMKSLRRVRCGMFSVEDALPHEKAMQLSREELLGHVITMQKFASMNRPVGFP